MSKRAYFFLNDEELGKRDDDHKPRPTWLPPLPSLRRKRWLGLIALAGLVWLFVANMPTDLGPANVRYAQRMENMGMHLRPPPAAKPPPNKPAKDAPPVNQAKANLAKAAAAKAALKAKWKGPAPDHQGDTPPVTGDETILGQTVHYFDGPVKFYYLGSSLNTIDKTNGQDERNKNVLFAASDLKSLSALVPLACEMTRWKRNWVHIAVMGRDEMPIDDIKELNGIDDDTCNVFWHDARPDYAIYSSDHRMEVSIAGALRHMQGYMHPQAIITTGSAHEDQFFTRAMRRKTAEMKHTLIEVPQDASDKMSWLSRLDAQALTYWHTATVDIVVQAPKSNSGSLVRLLKSLASADYDGFAAPRLTIELPPKLNNAASFYLDNVFQWPPSQFEDPVRKGDLVLRRRIPEERLEPYYAAVRFIESFYPADNVNSNVLVVSPQAQLSPVFFHTLKYYLLEYKYSEQNWMTSGMMGISLDAPSVHLNGSTGFEPPAAIKSAGSDDNSMGFYLWQAPNTNAGLYFGDKWIEAHSFLTQHLAAATHPATRDYVKRQPKQVSPKYPQWAESFLQLMRARGYYMLYPSLPKTHPSGGAKPATADALVVVHNELYEPPEEFLKTDKKTTQGSKVDLKDGAVLEGDMSYLATHLAANAKENDQGLNKEPPLLQHLRPLMPEGVQRDWMQETMSEIGGMQSALPPVWGMKVLDYTSDTVTIDDLQSKAKTVAVLFRQGTGGCSKERAESADRLGFNNADDLFCLPSDAPEAAPAREESVPNSAPPAAAQPPPPQPPPPQEQKQQQAPPPVKQQKQEQEQPPADGGATDSDVPTTFGGLSSDPSIRAKQLSDQAHAGRQEWREAQEKPGVGTGHATGKAAQQALLYEIVPSESEKALKKAYAQLGMEMPKAPVDPEVVTVGNVMQRVATLAEGELSRLHREQEEARDQQNNHPSSGGGLTPGKPDKGSKPISGIPLHDTIDAKVPGKGTIRGFAEGGIDEVKETEELKARNREKEKLKVEREGKAGVRGTEGVMRPLKEAGEGETLEAEIGDRVAQ